MTLTSRFPLRTIACLILAGQALLAHDPHDPMVAVTVSPNFANDQTVFAVTGLLSLKFGIYMLLKSTDGGVFWSVVQGINNTGPITQLVFSPAYADDQTLYVGCAGGLFMSTNQGTTWTQLFKTSVIDLALSPNFAVDNTLYLLTNKRMIIKSTNRGTTLSMVPLPATLTNGLSTVALSPNFDVDNTVLLGTISNGIYKSTNGGSSWALVTAGQTIQHISELVFSPNFASDHTAFAGSYGAGVLISTNDGGSWTFSNAGLSDLHVTSLVLSPTYLEDSTVWVASGVAGVSQSNDKGASWTLGANVARTLSTLTNVHYQSLAAAGNGQLYLAMYEGVWTSSNNAQSWLYIDTLPTRLIRHINMSPNYAQDHTFYTTTYGGGNVWSTDGGVSWLVKNTGMQQPYTDGSAISPNFAADQTAFSSNYQGLQKTTDGGGTWQLLQGLGAGVATYPRAVAVSPAYAQDSTVFIGLSVDAEGPTNTGPYISTDGGVTWQLTSLSGVTGVLSFAVSPAYATDRTVFTASPTNGLYKSIDGGFTYTLLTLPAVSPGMTLVAVSPAFATDQTVFAAGVSGGIYKSTDGGTTWTMLASTATLQCLDLQISPNYANDHSFFTGTLQKGFLKFTNAGTKVIVLPFPDALVTSIGISPNLATDHTLFAASYHGLYKSTTSGSAWTSTAQPARIEESRQANSTYAPQNPPSVTYQGIWAGVNPSAFASTNAFIMTSDSNATAVLNFTGNGVRWVGWKGPTQGMAAVTLDGVPQTTVDLNAPLDSYQVLIWQLQGLPCGLHTLTVTALPPQQPGYTVTVDAFDVWVNGCPIQ